MTIRDLANRWQKSESWKEYARTTAKRYAAELEHIVSRWGDAPLRLFGDRRVIRKIYEWRDRRSQTPRAADEGIRVLKQLLQFGHDQGWLPFNAAGGVGELGCQNDYSLTFWSDDDIASFLTHADLLARGRCADAVRFAAFAGIGLTDILMVQWSDIGEFTVSRPDPGPRKRPRSRTKLPRLPQLSVVLADLENVSRQDGVTTVLVGEDGRPWRRSTFHKHVDEVRKAADISSIDPITFERRPKRIQDLKNSYILHLLRSGVFSDSEVALIVNRPVDHVRSLRAAAL